MQASDAPGTKRTQNEKLLIELRRFTAGKTRTSRDVLAKRVPAGHDDPEFRAHELALQGRFIESAKEFINLLASESTEPGVHIGLAVGALRKAESGRRTLAADVIALAPRLAAQPAYIDLVILTSGVVGLERLDAEGLLPASTQEIMRRRRLAEAAKLLAKSDPIESTGNYLEAIIKTGLMPSRSPGDFAALMEASIALSSRLMALKGSNEPALTQACERFSTEAVKHGVFTPQNILDRFFKEADTTRKEKLARRLSGARSIFTDAYFGDEAVKAKLLEALINEACSAPAPVRSVRLLNSLTAASRTGAFWKDRAYRATLCSRLLDALPNIADVNAATLRARTSFAVGDLEAYEKAIVINKAFEEDSPDAGYRTYLDIDATIGVEPLRAPEVRELVSRSRHSDRAVAVACADIKYFRRWARAFATTHERVSGEMPHIHVMADAAYEAEISALAAQLPGLSVSIEEPAIRAPYYYATNRFLQLERLSTVVDQPIVVVDIDVVFISDVNDPLERHQIDPDAMFRINDRIRIFDHVQTHQLAYDYPRLDAWATVPAGYLYCSTSATGRRIARIVAEQAGVFLALNRNSGKSNWWIDQNLTFRALAHIRRELPRADIKNIADYGLPYGWRRPEGTELRQSSGEHPICRQYFDPRPNTLLDRARNWFEELKRSRTIGF